MKVSVLSLLLFKTGAPAETLQLESVKYSTLCEARSGEVETVHVFAAVVELCGEVSVHATELAGFGAVVSISSKGEQELVELLPARSKTLTAK